MASAAAPVASPPSSRIVSLDAFRGLTMTLMVIVNTAGSDAIYYQFKHAEWHGWTVADTIFPSFVWIVGVAITLVLGRKREGGVPRDKLLRQALRRSLILFVLGLLIYAAPDFNVATQRFLGVLQRIAICYFAATLLYLYTSFRTQIFLTVGLLAAYWLLLLFGPVPHYGVGSLTIEGNFAHYIDSLVLGAHNYRHTKTWDPEGVLSTLPAISTALFGVLAGYLLRLARPLAERVTWFLITGNLLLFVGLICSIWMPINKHLWSSSFVVFMAGLDFLVFGILLWLVDGCGYTKVVRPLVIMGMNAIAIYLASEFLAELIGFVKLTAAGERVSLQTLIYRSAFLPFWSDPTSALLYAIAYTLLMYALAYLLYRKGWFLRI